MGNKIVYYILNEVLVRRTINELKKIGDDVRVGMRNIKTAIAVFICVMISKVSKMEYPFYVIIATIVTMQNSVSGSFKTGKNRMLGTFVGAMIGLGCALIKPESAILSAIGIIILIYVCNLLKWNDSIVIGGIVFTAIMVNLKGHSPVFYSLNRLLDTFIGIGVAVLVNYFIFPPKYFGKVCSSSKELCNITETLIKDSIYCKKEIHLEKLNEQIGVLEKTLKLYIAESKARKNETLKIDGVKEQLSYVKKIRIHLQILQTLECSGEMDHKNLKNLVALINCGSEEVKEASVEDSVVNKDRILEKDIPPTTEENVVYNFHVAAILDRVKSLREIELGI